MKMRLKRSEATLNGRIGDGTAPLPVGWWLIHVCAGDARVAAEPVRVPAADADFHVKDAEEEGAREDEVESGKSIATKRCRVENDG